MSARVLAGLVLLGALALTRVAAAQGVSPGPLARDHASLEGVDNCQRCHSSGESVSAEKCTACHQALGERLAAKAGYHARVSEPCARCHPDHRGRDVPLVRWPGGSADKFDHAKLAGFVLRDAHAALACRKCHTPAKLSAPAAAKLRADEKPRTYLGLGTTCASCHEDPHKPTLGKDCQRCHDEKKWADAGTAAGGFDHAKTRFPLKLSHAQVACEKCHGGTAAKLADLHPKAGDCTACHKDPHAARMGDAASCTRCHDESKWPNLHYATATHAPRTLPLKGAHARPRCVDCHGAKLDKPVDKACVGCHADPHRPSLGSDCAACHVPTTWQAKGKEAATTSFHDRTAYPLAGRHAQVACAKCHDPKKPARLRFRPLPHARCLDCHADPHRGEASKPCEACHDVDGFQPARFELGDHAKTRFPLEGAHQALACVRCHPRAPASPGFARGAPACETCHQDPHGGQFAARPGGCATCHAVAAWVPSRFGKPEHARTALALAGRHDVACSRCHAAPTPGQPARFVGTGKDCGACHEDAHRGQLAGRACTSCHAGASFAPAPGFAHQATSFPLRGQHARTPCASCHPRTGVAGKPTTIYALGEAARACATCHPSPHGDLASPRAADRTLAAATRACATCHSEAGWQRLGPVAGFDHATTGTPLVGGHARAACRACHRADRARTPALAACASCHTDRHGGRLGDRCEACHSASTWKPDGALVEHQRTRLPLLGAHAVQGCPRCHKNAAAGDFRGLDPSCGSCHLHTVVERQPHPEHSGAAFAACEDCHSSMAWRPAHLDHDRFWPLTGKHTGTACAACHKGGSFSNAPTECIGCHQRDLDRTTTDHSGFGTQCATCHTTSAWQPAMFPDHNRFFPLRGNHAVPCAMCHTTPGSFQTFSCIDCHAHSRAQSDDQHQEVGGYSWVSTECYRCHPTGRGGG